MTQWANTCTGHAISLNTAGMFLGIARDDAEENAYSQDSQSFNSLVNRIKLVVTKDWTSALVDFVQQLNSSSSKIDREQAFALACMTVNQHYSLVYDAMVMMDAMYKVAEQVRANYVANLTSPSELDESPLTKLTPKPNPAISIPTPITPRWRCMVNGIGTGIHEDLLICLDTYYTPYEARDKHEVKCGSVNDPNPDVGGCSHPYYKCSENAVKAHSVKYCDEDIRYFPPNWKVMLFGVLASETLGKCGAPYRNCPGSNSQHGTHDYNGIDSSSDGGKYVSDIEGSAYGTRHSGNMSTSDSSFHGPTPYTETIKEVIDKTPSCDTCIDGSDNCPGCGSQDDDDEDATTATYHVCDSHESWQSGDHSAASCGQSGHFVCDSLSHVEEQCTSTNTNGSRCTYTFWRCEHPYVPSYGPSHIHTYPVPPPPAIFTPSLSLTYTSSTGSVSMTVTANEPIFGADLYVRFPGDTSQYGTKIGWTSGNSNATTYSLPVNYSFPASAASGTYKFTLRVYPFNNSGSGNAWGVPYDVFEDVTVD